MKNRIQLKAESAIKIIQLTEFQNKLFKEVYQIQSLLSPIEHLDLERSPMITESLATLIHFVIEHDIHIVQKLSMPRIIDNRRFMYLGNNALEQLGIISKDRREFTLLKMLDKSATALGRRLLKERLLNPIMEKENPEAVLINCDISRPLLGLAKDRLSKRAYYVCADNRFFPVKSSSLDVLFSSFCVRNSLNPILTVKEAFRVLKGGGVWGILDFFRVKKRNVLTTANGIVFKSFMSMNKLFIPSHSKAIDYLFKSIRSFYSMEEFCEILKNSGFKVVEVESFMGGIAHTVIAIKN